MLWGTLATSWYKRFRSVRYIRGMFDEITANSQSSSDEFRILTLLDCVRCLLYCAGSCYHLCLESAYSSYLMVICLLKLLVYLRARMCSCCPVPLSFFFSSLSVTLWWAVIIFEICFETCSTLFENPSIPYKKCSVRCKSKSQSIETVLLARFSLRTCSISQRFPLYICPV